MWIKNQHCHLKKQLELKIAELQKGLENPSQCIGFLNLLQDVEFLYMQVNAYEDALNDIKNSLEGK